MQYGDFFYPMPANEPVLNYATGSPEKLALKKMLKQLKSEVADIPLYIGSEEVRTGKKTPMRPPHEHKHLLGNFHNGDASHVKQAIDAALQAKEKWAGMAWENRANIFLKAADLLATNYRASVVATTMLGQSKNPYQAEIDAACDLLDFLRVNVHFLSEIYRQTPVSGSGRDKRMESRQLGGLLLAV